MADELGEKTAAERRSRATAAGTEGSQPTQWGSERVNRSTMHGLWALTNRELQKWYKVPVLLLMSLIQPIIWLGLFGKAMNFGAIFSGGSFNIPGLNIPKQVLDSLSSTIMQSTFGTTDYFSFLAVGMLAFVCLFTAMFSGMSILWDRRLGFLDKVLSTPVSRGTIIMGKVLSSVVRSLAQAAVVLLIAIPLGLDLGKITLFGVLGTFAAMFLMTLGFSALFLTLALRSTDWQSQMAIMNLLNLPLLFGSNALFPSKLMPDWLQAFVSINPISYATDAGRQLLLGTTGFASLGFDFAYLAGFAILLSALGVFLSWKLLTK
ncbi:MAG: ABC transporter permease [Nitrososphaerales archaeon]|nr:ABC transporter permease [Nitrososphaerales archaeon]